MKTEVPLISVCVPLFETEMFLAQCLESVLMQDYDDFEVVIVSDASNGKDANGHKAKKIISRVEKGSKKQRALLGLKPVYVKFIEHHENRGLIEVRRTLVYESRGHYIAMLDSDDLMEEGALKTFAEYGKSYDIVHGTSTAGSFNENGVFIPAKQNRYGAIFYGAIEGRNIFHSWLVKQEFTANTWGKLIRRELFEKAYENIPYTECNLGEDLLLFFFISQYAKSYIGIRNKVVRYRITSGMTSSRQISSLKQWKMICSTSSVFNILSSWIKETAEAESALLPEEISYIRNLTIYYLENNIRQLQGAVHPDLQKEAYEMLCEYWGESFVKRVEESSRQ